MIATTRRPLVLALRGARLIPLALLEPRPARVFTSAGWMAFEEEYIARVVTRENGNAAAEALKAQAVAARTFVLRAMRDDAALGTERKPLANSERFQTFASTANEGSLAATRATAGVVARWQGQLVLGNYVAGALLGDDGKPKRDPTNTERFVTYNDGKRGGDVAPTKLANPKRPDNRGCMSQNGGDWLARRGRDYAAILRFYYGADLELDGGSSNAPSSTEPVPGSSSSPPSPGGSEDASSSSSSAAPLVVAGAAALALFWST